MMLVDSHCHLDRLDLTPYDGKLEGALNNAREHGVGHMLCVCIDLEHLEDVLEPARQYDFVNASVGVHPNEHEGEEPDCDRLVALAQDEQVVAIGETGLDYFRSEGDLEWQRERFRQHIAAAGFSPGRSIRTRWRKLPPAQAVRTRDLPSASSAPASAVKPPSWRR